MAEYGLYGAMVRYSKKLAKLKESSTKKELKSRKVSTELDDGDMHMDWVEAAESLQRNETWFGNL